MFASISRRSSRIRKSYICSSCLCNIAAHLPLLASVHERVPHLGASTPSQPFSTSTPNYKGKDGAESSQSTDAKSAKANQSENPSKSHKAAQAVTKKERRGNAQSPSSTSKSASSISTSKVSTLAGDPTVLPPTLAGKSNNEPKKKGMKVVAKKDHKEPAKSPGKATKESKTEPTKNAATAKTGSVGGRKKGKKDTQTSVVPGNTEQNSVTEPKEKTSKKATVAKAKTAFKGSKVKPRLAAKTFKGISKFTARDKDTPISIRKVQTRGTEMTEIPAYRQPREDPTTVMADVKAFADQLEDASSDSSGPPTHARRMLVELIQSGKLKGDQRLEAIKLLRRLLLVQPEALKPSSSPSEEFVSEDLSLKKALLSRASVDNVASSHSPRDSNHSSGKGGKRASVKAPLGPVKIAKGTTDYEIKTIDSDELQLVPLESDGIEVPRLAYGLDRVLFNPGVYQLQDPRSKVYNFDPYLQKIMPASEFDFNALAPYITSSRDQTLLGKAKENSKKYTGSTSSMTSALAHFHFLLSAWRPISTGNLSKQFPVEYESFTALQRAPNAIFLRNRDGVFAIDADKQYDSANILMMLGKSMEKQLTMPTAQFEKYRKGNSHQISEEERNAPESFHYTTIGDFLLRSQLDAYDPRLPGSGMFDLKTRAVIAVRMDAEQYEEGRGYQIRSRQGEWESYEREYFDMIRAAFLKYSLQVRMGRMDGIFVAFHNTTKIFGFQYISLPEMDLALHGTEDTTIGDNEFKLSLELLNRVLDRATAKFPGESLRLHFETRDATTPFMYIFAEPVDEERIDQIQTTNKAKIEEFERRVCGLAGQHLTDEDRKAEWDNIRAEVADSMEIDDKTPDELEDVEDIRESSAEELVDAKVESDVEALSEEELEEMEKIISSAPEETEEDTIAEAEEVELESSDEAVEMTSGREGQDADVTSAEANEDAMEEDAGEEIAASESIEQEEIVDEDASTIEEAVTKDDDVNLDDSDPLRFSSQSFEPSHKEILGMTLTIRNKLDGDYIERPQRLDNGQKWEVEYALEEMAEGSTMKHYTACLKRRKSALVRSVDLTEVASWNDLFIQTIKRLSEEGKLWREKEDMKEQDLPIKTLYPVDGKTITERAREDQFVSKPVQEIEELVDNEGEGSEETISSLEESQSESESLSSDAESVQSEVSAPTEIEGETELDLPAKEAENKS